mmetsp:Transcript_39345/g.91831  ORF Transcript_39345/g.91831 Transcript_39345/m.91831 type:complete len:174 (-) Transcript_39345:1287-1808(-)
MVQSVASLFLLPAFVVSFHSVSLPQPSFLNNVRSTTLLRGTITDAYGLPCDDECAVDKFPNLPDSVHPGIVTGQALRDLLDHAKENGYAIPAVNCVSSSGINACLEAAREMDAPIIVQFSSGGSQACICFPCVNLSITLYKFSTLCKFINVCTFPFFDILFSSMQERLWTTKT